MAKFEVAKGFEDIDIDLIPKRATANSAGYDFVCAKDTIIPSYIWLMDLLGSTEDATKIYDLSEVAALTKTKGIKPTLVPTGIKCQMPDDMYLELAARSSLPLKHWVILANGEGIIDSDYYGNPDNDGMISFQLINLSPFDIMIPKGERIGQGILKKYYTVDDDVATGARMGGFGSTNN